MASIHWPAGFCRFGHTTHDNTEHKIYRENVMYVHTVFVASEEFIILCNSSLHISKAALSHVGHL